MKCYHPISAYLTESGIAFRRTKDEIKPIQLPCGQCIGCREKRRSQWEMRIMHEAQTNGANAFVTLTYEDRHLPPNNSLQHRDYQLFAKRLRERTQQTHRYYMVGEYGDTTERPHYHACIFGLDFREDREYHAKSATGHPMYTSKLLTDTWQLGHATVQDLTRETAGYCAGYIQKKILGRQAAAHYSRINTLTGETYHITPEYARMSQGIGRLWFETFHRDVFPHDAVIHNGTPHPVPRYYTERAPPQYDIDTIKELREMKGAANPDDNTPERLAVQETVLKARLRNRKRDQT